MGSESVVQLVGALNRVRRSGMVIVELCASRFEERSDGTVRVCIRRAGSSSVLVVELDVVCG